MKIEEPTEPHVSHDLSLDEFPAHTYDDWREAAEKLLKGAPFDKLLISKTYEGFDLDPIYRREDIAGLAHLASQPGFGNQHRGGKASGYRQLPWLVSQQTCWRDPAEFNVQVKNETAKGVTEVNIPVDTEDGLMLNSLEDIDTAFDELDWQNLSFNLQSATRALPLAAALVAYLNQEGLPLEAACGCIDNDPLGYLAQHGELPFSLETAFEEMAEVTKFAGENCPAMKTIGVRGIAYANGGASSAQELGYMLATSLTYIKEMQDRGIPTDVSARRIRFTISIGPNFFLEIAKLRAARILWSQLIKHLGSDPEKCKLHIHCRTGLTNKTLFDAQTNILRTTTEALSAVLGNCDSLDIAPYDELNPQGENLSRRIARNMHTILREECDLKRVIDPGGGSYYLEWLTDKLAKQAWASFQSIEKAGGMIAALKEGIPQTACSAIASARSKNVSRRKEKLVGTNMYPNATEKILATLESDGSSEADSTPEVRPAKLNRKKNRFDAAVEAATGGADIAAITEALHGREESVTVEAIKIHRLAENYESLRLAAENFEATTGQKPAILQLNLGPSRRYRIRADWTSSFFQVGGFDVQNERDFEDKGAVIEAVTNENPKVAIITSDDKTYAAEIPELAAALKTANPDMHLLVAGYPGDNETAWKEAGVDDFVHIRVNNFDMLKSIQSILGVQS